jgi:hypothetical protein
VYPGAGQLVCLLASVIELHLALTMGLQHVDLSTRAHAAPAHLVELAEPIFSPVKASSPPQTSVKLGEVTSVIVSQLALGTQQRASSMDVSSPDVAHEAPAQKAPPIKAST